MSLPTELVSQLVKTTMSPKETNKETTVHGTTVIDDSGKAWVKLDGSDVLTPISTTTDVKNDERVIVTIKDHTATVTGNLSSPSARTDDVKDVDKKVDNEVTRINGALNDKVETEQLEAEQARIGTLEADNVTIKGTLQTNSADIGNLKADNATIKGELKAAAADIETLQATDVTITGKLEAAEAKIEQVETTKLDADIADIKFATIGSLDATNAQVNNLNATHASFQEATAKNFEATNAEIGNLKADKLDATAADIKYATLDFANIGEAAIQKIFAGSGLIKDLVVGNQTVTGEIVGVTISGDLIKANTLKADKLVVKGSDGIYYKLNVEAGAVASTEVSEEDLQNGLHGSNIIAKTITAEKIAVTDLVAFGATIGGYHMTGDSLYSGTKESVSNTTPGVYFGADGQFAVGNSGNFLKFYKNDNGSYILEISASRVIFGASGQTVEDALGDINDRVDATNTNVDNLGTRVDTAESDITSVNGRVDETNTNVDALGTRVDTAESDITSVNGRVDETNTNVDALGTRVDTAESDITSVTERVDTAESDISTLNDNTAELDTRVGDSETSINDLNDTASALDTRVGDAETNITDLTTATDELDGKIDKTNETLDTVQEEIGAVKDNLSGILMDIEALTKNAEYIYIGSYEDEPCIELGERDSDFKVIITNTRILFAQGATIPAHITNELLHIDRAVVKNELQQGGFAWKARTNGNLGLVWKGVTE